MRLTIVGCADAFGTGGRDSTCYHLAVDGYTAVLDFGFSAPNAAKRRGIAVSQIDCVLLSHLHGDHFGGLPVLLIDGQYGETRSRPLTIVGPPGTTERLWRTMEALYPGTSTLEWRFPLTITEVEPGASIPIGPLTLTTAQVIHPSGAPSTALRVAHDGRVLAFSGDTQWTEALLPIAAGADLFICECFGFEGQPYGHLSYEILDREHARLGAKRTLLTHMGPEMLARRDRVDPARFMLAQDGLHFDL